MTVNQAQVKQEERQANEANVENEDDDEEDDDYNEDEDVDVNEDEDEDVYDIDEDDYVDDDDDEDENNGYNYFNNNLYLPNSNMNILNTNPLLYDIQICGTMYTIDFKNMIQYPQYMPYRKRKICRAKGLPSKGVAGLLSYTRRPYRKRPY